MYFTKVHCSFPHVAILCGSNAHYTKSFLGDVDKRSGILDISDNETSRKESLSAANKSKLSREREEFLKTRHVLAVRFAHAWFL